MSERGKAQAGAIVELFFDGLLLLCFLVQAFLLGCLLAYGQLPLPVKWTSEKITRQFPEGLSLHADSYALTLDGNIRMENIQLHLDGIHQPVFAADYANVEFGTKWDKDQPLYVKGCILTNGTLRLPAVYSPDGNDSSILEHIAMRILPTEKGIAVDSFAALHEDIRLRGRINWTTEKDVSKPINLPQKADLFFKQAANILKQEARFDRLTQPTILFKIDAGSNRPLNILSTISSRAYNHPKIQAKNLRFDATLELTNQSLVSNSSIFLQADEVQSSPYNTRASFISAKVEREEWEALLKGEWPDMEIVAETLDIGDIHLESPRIKLSPQAFPDIAFDGLTSGLQGAVQFSGSVNAQTRAANIRAAGSIDLLSIAPKKVTDRLPAIKVNQAPYYNLTLNFDDGLTLSKAELRARVDTLEVEDLNFDHIRFRANYNEGVYSINQFYLRRDWQWLNLGFNLDSSTDDYALTLKGFAKPYDYNATLPRWWGAIFKEFDFEQVESGLGDFVIYGNTNKKAADLFFGHASARNVGYKDVRVDEGELFVRGRGSYAEVHQLNARSGEGFARGDIRFASRLDEVRGPMSVHLDLDTKLPLSDAKKLFDENIAAILADFETDALPHTILRGTIYNSAYPEFEGLSHIDLTANCDSPISYKDLPLDNLSFDLNGRKGTTYLRNIRFGYAGGQAEAKADILTGGDGPVQTRFQLSLKDANQDQAIGLLSALKQGSSEPVAEETTPGEGRLNLELHASGPVEGPFQMNGRGSFRIENEELYAIQIFGPLSKLLQNTRLGFSSFALNEMQANFALEQGTVRFEQLEINGPRTRIEAPGTMKLDDFSLDMRVSVYLFGNAGNPNSSIRRFSELITKPIPNLLEFELTGTPENQKWRSLYDPRNFIPQF